jgi:hypothetical protein
VQQSGGDCPEALESLECSVNDESSVMVSWHLNRYRLDSHHPENCQYQQRFGH